MNLTLSSRNPYPLNAADIAVVDKSDEVRLFEPSDWPEEYHKLLIFIPEVNTPVCKTELGAINEWADRFLQLGCMLIACGTDGAGAFLNWYQEEPLLQNRNYNTFSSFQVPARLGLLENGHAKRSSVFITKQGEIVKQEHFYQVGRSFSELHRMFYGYTTDSYCAEGWTNPNDGFLPEKKG